VEKPAGRNGAADARGGAGRSSFFRTTGIALAGVEASARERGNATTTSTKVAVNGREFQTAGVTFRIFQG